MKLNSYQQLRPTNFIWAIIRTSCYNLNDGTKFPIIIIKCSLNQIAHSWNLPTMPPTSLRRLARLIRSSIAPLPHVTAHPLLHLLMSMSMSIHHFTTTTKQCVSLELFISKLGPLVLSSSVSRLQSPHSNLHI